MEAKTISWFYNKINKLINYMLNNSETMSSICILVLLFIFLLNAIHELIQS